MVNHPAGKRVLIVTYYWPPSGGAGVQRWLKFAKYLPLFGWEPVILTVDPEKASYPQKDYSLSADVAPTTMVYHTSTFEWYSLYQKLSSKGEIPYGGFANEDNPGLFKKISRFVRGNLFIPDPRKGWNRYALKKAAELISELNIQAVITTGTPHSSHLIGLALKQRFALPWIADFRDPWIDAYYYDMFYQTRFARWIDRRLENKVLKKSDLITTVSRGLKTIFSDKAQGQYQQKIRILTNGFDPDDFLIDTKEQNPGFTIVYAGTMTPAYRISSFLAAIQRIIVDIPEVRVHFYGKISEEILLDIKRREIDNCILYKGYIPHKELYKVYQQADMLLLVIPDFLRNEGIVTGKIFEYLAANTPILVIGPEQCDAATIVSETSSGLSHTYDNTKGIEQAVRSFVQHKKDGIAFRDSSMIQMYSRKEISRNLAELLDSFSPDGSS
jgi:glycosyltransferase involved in cell wall biosynthesis